MYTCTSAFGLWYLSGVRFVKVHTKCRHDYFTVGRFLLGSYQVLSGLPSEYSVSYSIRVLDFSSSILHFAHCVSPQ